MFHNNLLILLLVLIVRLDDSVGQVIQNGECNPSVNLQENFNALEFVGRWHEISRTANSFQSGQCSEIVFENSTTGVYTLEISSVNDNFLQQLDGVARLDGLDSAKFLMNFPALDNVMDFNVLSTDYETYALVYSCETIRREDNTVERSINVWKLGRETSYINDEMAHAMMDIIISNELGINAADTMYNINHSEDTCVSLPVIESGDPIFLPGQCNENITAFENLNITSYSGLWHLVSKYPDQYLDGSCNDITYTVDDGDLIQIVTSQVRENRVYETVTGTAVLDDSDGYAKLIVSYPGRDDSIYWILDTDYESYSIVYSCENIGSDYKHVWSWKLSREMSLSADAEDAINNVMSNMVDLNNRFYQAVDNTYDGCLYLPEPVVGQPLLFRGQCDMNIPVVTNFDAVGYMGEWHSIERYPSIFQGGDCNTALYTLTPESTVHVYNTQVFNETLDEMEGVGVLASDDGSAKLIVSFPIFGTEETTSTDYWVLGTDYENYALVYTCQNFGSDSKYVWSWKLSRTKELSPEAITAINNIVETIPVLDQRYYEIDDHSPESCFYYPVPVDGESVIFPGQCNESISVVENFDVVRYLNLWYDVSSYPQLFQNGQCAQATYSLNDDGTVQVYNTQVVGQQLDTMTGVARLASDDGSAKLEVTFQITPDIVNTASYWVLDTDYDNYALVYGCRNLGSYRRQVSSWKLSRQPTLSSGSAAAMDAVIDTIQVLRPEYYEDKSQTEEDCFFYPDNNGGPIYFDGQCDAENQVPYVENFEPDRFDGLWYEISRFPSELRTGECINADIDLANGNGEITIYFIDQEQENNVTIPVTSDNENGIITITILDGSNNNVNLPIYVLATDYDEYALLYGCRNVDGNRKQIYSWKLSRAKEGLTDESNTVIDRIVYDKDDLFEGYYEITDQSDESGCFYYPIFVNPESITLPGRCPESIVGKSDFEAGRYLGRWFEVARYPTRQQVGQCARAEYSLGDGVVDVFNTIVNENVLESIDGTATVASTDGTGLLNVSFTVNGMQLFSNYYIMASDYDNYALVYSCFDLPNGNRQVSSWVLSRQRTLEDNFYDYIDPVIEETQGLLKTYYQQTDQSDESCFYIPEPNLGENLLFRGQCDENIQGVEGFDLERYLGWWHEVESYPTNSSLVDCISTQYENVDGQYRFIDTRVSGLSGEITSGNVVVSADAPGKITKTADDGTTTDIWVLATDYETFSLLYSCQNVNEEYRRVWSAKHGKSKELTAAAREFMQPIIDANEVLYDTLYTVVDLSTSACFFYPEPTGVNIVIPGQCEENIPVVQDFNVTAYSGDWFQIERYPQIHETGYCSGARYELVDGSVRVTNWQVIDGRLDTTRGTAVISSTDGSAKLSVTLPVPGSNSQTTTAELYVLLTDYVSYSLVYNCRNLPNGNQRYVGAWKLSRFRILNFEGNAAINTHMSTREELHQPYFQNTEQIVTCPVPASSHLVKSTLGLLILTLSIKLFV